MAFTNSFPQAFQLALTGIFHDYAGVVLQDYQSCFYPSFKHSTSDLENASDFYKDTLQKATITAIRHLRNMFTRNNIQLPDDKWQPFLEKIFPDTIHTDAGISPFQVLIKYLVHKDALSFLPVDASKGVIEAEKKLYTQLRAAAFAALKTQPDDPASYKDSLYWHLECFSETLLTTASLVTPELPSIFNAIVAEVFTEKFETTNEVRATMQAVSLPPLLQRQQSLEPVTMDHVMPEFSGERTLAQRSPLMMARQQTIGSDTGPSSGAIFSPSEQVSEPLATVGATTPRNKINRRALNKQAAANYSPERVDNVSLAAEELSQIRPEASSVRAETTPRTGSTQSGIISSLSPSARPSAIITSPTAGRPSSRQGQLTLTLGGAPSGSNKSVNRFLALPSSAKHQSVASPHSSGSASSSPQKKGTPSSRGNTPPTPAAAASTATPGLIAIPLNDLTDAPAAAAPVANARPSPVAAVGDPAPVDAANPAPIGGYTDGDPIEVPSVGCNTSWLSWCCPSFGSTRNNIATPAAAAPYGVAGLTFAAVAPASGISADSLAPANPGTRH